MHFSVQKTVSKIMDTIKSLAPAVQSGKRFDPETEKIRVPAEGLADLSPIDVHIQDLMKRSLEVDSVAHMAPSWLPWM